MAQALPSARPRRAPSRPGWSLLLAFALLTGVACGNVAGSSRPAGTAMPPAPSGATPRSSLATEPAASAGPVRIVAAENFYGDVAGQIGGDRVSVVSILSDPNADPHEYESNSDDARAVADAQIVIRNSLGYDAFVDKLMSASPRPSRIVLDVAQITGHREGDNPHVWYEPTTMPRVARALADALTRLDPAGRDYFAARLAAFDASEQAVDARIAAIRAKDAGARVLETEPVFDYMAEALGLDVVDKDGPFPRAVEDGNDPPAGAVADFRAQLASGAVKVLLYNRQAETPITTQMQTYARENHVGIVPITETEPTGKTYQQWMLDQLASLQRALGG